MMDGQLGQVLELLLEVGMERIEPHIRELLAHRRAKGERRRPAAHPCRHHGLVTIHERSIRFFRVVNVEGEPTFVLLAQAVADSADNHAATLPTR